MLSSGTVFIRDNARPHTAATTKSLLKHFRWEVFDYPPSSARTYSLWFSFLSSYETVGGKGHAGLRGNERADYLAEKAASYKTKTDYSAIPLSRGKKLLKDYYINLWNAIYTNSEVPTHTKLFIPDIFHRLSLSLWPNYILTQFLTNHGCFRSYPK